MKLFIGTGLAIVTLAATPFLTQADERPPADARPLVDVITAIEETGFTPLVEASFDDGNWEIEAYQDDQAYELLVDPTTGEVVSKHRDEADTKPPADGIRLSEIISSLTKAGYTDVHDVSFEGQSWEVEALRDGVKRELRVSPMNGEVISDRADD